MLLDNFLSGKNFSKISDYVYCETIKDENNKPKIVRYPINFNLLEDNDVIFCKTDYVINFFNDVKNVEKKINLITHESDYSITKEIFDLKPKCVNKWYAINVEFSHEDLIPIPLGLANDYCNITLKIKDLQFKKDQKKMLYVNHRTETNRKAREWIYKFFQTNEWCTVKNPNLTFEEYKRDLSEHKFMLCPRGNGVDTHRLWECLYAGIIPIVENHVNFKNMLDLPIMFVDSFKDVTLKSLNDFNDKKANIEKLNIQTWEKLIKNERSN